MHSKHRGVDAVGEAGIVARLREQLIHENELPKQRIEERRPLADAPTLRKSGDLSHPSGATTVTGTSRWGIRYLDLCANHPSLSG